MEQREKNRNEEKKQNVKQKKNGQNNNPTYCDGKINIYAKQNALLWLLQFLVAVQSPIYANIHTQCVPFLGAGFDQMRCMALK